MFIKQEVLDDDLPEGSESHDLPLSDFQASQNIGKFIIFFSSHFCTPLNLFFPVMLFDLDGIGQG